MNKSKKEQADVWISNTKCIIALLTCAIINPGTNGPIMTYIHEKLTNVSVIPSHTSSITLCIKESLTTTSSEEGTGTQS
jgi:hypothetical protein